MFASAFLLVALAALGLAQNTTDTSKIRRVYLTSNVNTKFVVTAGGTTAGSSLVVFVFPLLWANFCPIFLSPMSALTLY